MNNLSKREMIRQILNKAKQENEKIYQYELQIMSKPFVEHFYNWYVLGIKKQFDLA